MLHKGTIIVTTLLISLAVGVFVIDPLSVETPVPQKAALVQTTSSPDVVVSDTTPRATSTDTNSDTLPTFTKETLARYDGSDPSLPIYIAFEGNVYDVTPGRTFYEPGAAYHFLAGTDGTEMLRLVGGDIIKKKYTVIGTFQE